MGEGARVIAALAHRLVGDALADGLEHTLAQRLGVPVHVGLGSTGREALVHALRGAGRDTETVASWPCSYASLTHSRDVAIAVALPPHVRAIGIGIDLEHDRPMKPDMARLICGADERAWLDSLPAGRRDAELLRLWTAKEALYKADPTQGDAIVAEYTLASPGDEVTTGGRRESVHRAMVTSLRHPGAVMSVALRLSGDPS